MKNTKKKGFTIVELVIVIAVIAILAAVAIPSLGSVITKANKSAAMQNAEAAYKDYLVDHAETMDTMNLCIESGSYHFHVTKGQFSADPATCAEGESFTAMTITNGKLVAKTTTPSTGE